MTSADFLQFVVTTDFSVCKTSSGKRNLFHLIYLLHLHLETRAVSDFVLSCKLVHFKMPYMQFLFVRPRFCPQGHFQVPTSDFFQTPPHDGPPCLRLTVPTAKPVVDFHHQVITHAEHTRKGTLARFYGLAYLFLRVAVKNIGFLTATHFILHGFCDKSALSFRQSHYRFSVSRTTRACGIP